VCFSFLGMPREGVRAARTAIAKARTSRLLRSFFAQAALGNAASTLRGLGRWDEVLTLTREVWGEVVPHTEPATALHLACAEILTSRGDSAAAAPLVEHLISVMRTWPADSALTRGMRARLHLLAGEHELALDAVEDGFATCRLDQPEVVGPTGLLFVCDGLTVAAEVSTVPGLRGRAVRVVDTLDAARAALTAGVGVLDVPLFAACDEWACAEAARAHGCDHADAWGRQERVWARLGDPYRVAYARYRRGAALLAAGDRRGAAHPLRQALESTSGLGAAPLVADIVAAARRARIELTVGPGRARVDAEVPDGAAKVGLTPRECDVLERLMGGRSDRQIARELGISERTVGVHVSHVLGKLGVASRGEAAAVAHRTHLLQTARRDASGSMAATQNRAPAELSPRTP